MLDRSTVERLGNMPPATGYVVSVYLGHGPDIDDLRAIPTKVHSLLSEVRSAAGEAEGNHRRSLLRDLDEVQSMVSELGSDLGRGTALFVCRELGLREHVTLPAPVRDRVVVDTTPYVGPMQAMLDHFHRYAAVVVDRRGASVYRFHLGELQSWEHLAADEPIRKDNYGGFGGYEEHRVRGHAEEVARRLFRTVAERLVDLSRTGAFDLLAVGGNAANTAALVQELPSDVAARLAGTFVVDPSTATQADIRTACRRLAAEHDDRTDAGAIAEVTALAASGGLGVIGLDNVIDAANLAAVRRLLVAAEDSVPGVSCETCGSIGRDGETCEVCGAATRAVADLVDALAGRVRATGGTVRYLLGPSALSGSIVGATLRYSV